MSIFCLVTILFPELEKLMPTLHMASIYVSLSEVSGVWKISSMHLTRMTNLLETASKGHYSKSKAIELRDAARTFIGFVMPVKSLEFQHTSA